MASFKITETQKQRLLELYNTPTNELKSKDIPALIEKEMGFKVPYNLLNDFYQKGFGLDLAKRKRKSEILVFEFENGKSFVINNVEPEEETTTNENNVLSTEEEVLETEETVVDSYQEVEEEPSNYALHQKEPVNFEF